MQVLACRSAACEHGETLLTLNYVRHGSELRTTWLPHSFCLQRRRRSLKTIDGEPERIWLGVTADLRSGAVAV